MFKEHKKYGEIFNICFKMKEKDHLIGFTFDIIKDCLQTKKYLIKY